MGCISLYLERTNKTMPKKRSDGNYQRSITIGKKPDGSPRRKVIYAKTQKELELRVSEYKRKFRTGTLSADNKMTFGEAAELWIENYKPTIGINSKDMYYNALNAHLLPELCEYKLKDLKSFHVQTIINYLAKLDRSESLMKKVKITAVQIMQLAIDRDVIHRNVFTGVKIPHIASHKRRPLTNDERQLVFTTYSDHPMGIPALLLLYCGLRRGELLALTWTDIQIDKQSININKAVEFNGNNPQTKDTKTYASTRVVPIPDIIMAAIIHARKISTSVMVCPSTKKLMMTKSAWRRAWENYQEYLNIQAGGKRAYRNNPGIIVLDNLTSHMFRHTYATMLYDAGVDIKTAQYLLGHSDIKVTLEIYTHLSRQKKGDGIAKLNKHLSGKIQ